MRVSPKSTLNTMISHLRDHGDEQKKAFVQLSSGKRITKAADDAAGLAHAKKLDGLIRSQRQATRNANDGISFVQTAEGGLNEMSNIIVRLRELSVQAGSDTVGDSEREFLDKEYQSLVEEVDRISLATSFNGTNVINDPDKGELDFHVGAFAEEENIIKFDVDSNHIDSDELGLSGSGVADKEGALENIQSLDEALERISSQRSYLGAIQSRLGHATQNLEISTINHEATRSKIEDADVAETAARLTTTNLLKQSAVKAISQGIDLSKQTYRLIS